MEKKMLNKKVVLLSTVSMIALGACSNTQIGPAPGFSKAEAVTYEYKHSRVEEQVSTIPEWFKSQPEDKTNIYSAGTSVTPDMQFSIDAAILNAKVILADRINSRLRSQIKQFRAMVGEGDLDATVMTELEKAVKNITVNTDVSGYHVNKLDIVPHGTQYRAYVLLEYSDSEARKILSNRLRKDKMLFDRLRATKAWKELDATAEKEKEDDKEKFNTVLNSMSD
jgi:hypothetical protein